MNKKEMDEIRKAAREKSKAKVDEVKKAMPAALQKAAGKKPAPSPSGRVYTVQAGDSLSKIALELLGDASRWKEIFEANTDQLKDPNLIRVGQELKIP